MKFRVVHVNPGEKLNKNGNYNDIIQKSLVFPNKCFAHDPALTNDQLKQFTH